VGQKVVKLREDRISNIFLSGRFGAREHRLCLLDCLVIYACSTCGSDFSVGVVIIFSEDILSLHVDDVGGI